MTAAIILAGGLGTRLRSVVPDLPKPMAPVAGRPFLEILLDYWIDQGVDRFVLSVGYRHDAITGHFGKRYRNADLDYVIEQTPLGTGGGLLLAAEKLDGDDYFLLLNGDTYFAVDLAALTQFAIVADADWCFGLFRANEAGRYMGMEVGADGAIGALKSGAGEPGRLANGGVYLIRPRALAASAYQAGQKVSLEDDILPSAKLAGQRLFGKECTGNFIDIGVPHDYALASTLLAK